MIELINSPGFWLAVMQIIAIDILLGGDNAVVIALACRKLPEAQRNRAIIGGALGAILLRIGMIFFALQLLEWPLLKLIGALLLLWIGIKLMVPEDEDAHDNMTASPKLWGAIKTIIVADAVMSLDNVVAVAGASGGQIELVVFGIVISIPIIIWGSKLVLHFMDRYPIVITLGAALLGWIAGSMAITDISLPAVPAWAHYGAGIVGVTIVLIIGKCIVSSNAAAGDKSEIERRE
ncbi:TerC family protein [Pseudomonas salomonii]|uniref:Integral membrane protein, YjbE family n=1 Tax=Pseudomonas salomonii TaxID=191391 RepID=A0A1H3UIP6_9PSED|nr:TerC family protein [Pseudomonas salomonii]SDZ61715.1 integral membrane protein, YjbE family [Pseudomonas salomonii]